MKKVTIALLFVMCLFSFGCSSKSVIDDVVSNNVLILGEVNKDGTLFNKHFKLESIVAIETNDSCLINGIRRVIAYKEKLLLLNGYYEVLIIDSKTGRYMGRIRNIGDGPGEYTQIMDIAFDEKEENILIYSDMMKLLVYDLHLNFIEEQYIGKELFEGLICADEVLYFYNPLSIPHKQIISVYDMKLKRWIKEIGNESLAFNIRYEGVPFCKSRSIWFVSPLQNRMSYITDMSVENEYEIEMEGFGEISKLMDLQHKGMSFFEYISEENICYALTCIRETSRFVYCKSNIHSLIIIDKETKEVKSFNFLSDNSTGVLDLNYFSHDGDDERIMCIVSPQKWISRNSSSSEIKGEHLKINADSNPLLFFYTEK